MGKERIKQGIVVSNKMDKTITVLIERRVPHPLYKKIVKKRLKVYAHDEKNDAREGDVVAIKEVRPLSKKKRWTLVKIIERKV